MKGKQTIICAMRTYDRSKFTQGKVTLNSLKEECYSLNMRLRLAIQTGDTQAKMNIEKEIAENEVTIRQMTKSGS